MPANLGSKRQCPKCEAKFYDLGASEVIVCPKCKHSWKEGAGKKKAKAKPKPPVPVLVKKAVLPPKPKTLGDPSDTLNDFPEVEEGDEIAELEPVEDDSVEMVSLEEVEEHEEEKEVDAEGDDAEDEMFTTITAEESLVDDLEQYIEKDEDEDEEDGEEE